MGMGFQVDSQFQQTTRGAAQALDNLSLWLKGISQQASAPVAGLEPDLLEKAEKLLAALRYMLKHFGKDIFGTPAISILLDLYIMERRGRTTSISSLCLASGSPSTTGLRYISRLTGMGLIERHPHPSDGRGSLVRLTNAGISEVAEFLTLI